MMITVISSIGHLKMLLVTVLAVLLSVYLYYRWKNYHYWKCAATLPQDPCWPIIGNSWKLIRNWDDICYVHRDVIRRYQEKGLYAFIAGPAVTVLVWEVSYIEKIISSESTSRKGGFMNFVVGDVNGGVAVQSGGTKWSELKKPLNKLFTKKQLSNEYHQLFVKKAKVLTKFILDKRLGEEYHVLPDCFHLCLDSVMESHMGVASNEIEENRYSFLENYERYLDKAVHSAVVYNDPFFYLKGRKRPGRDNEMMKIITEINKVAQWVLDERRRIHPSLKSKHGVQLYPDFLLQRGHMKGFPDEEIRRELLDIMSATESTGVMFASALLYIAIFPEVQEEVLREQLEVMEGDREREPSAEDLERMEYLDRVLQETLRHVSPLGTTRAVREDLQLDQYTIPKGAVILISADGLHQSPKYWERPNEFFPDHFLPEKVAARPDLAFIPFGIGNRSCSGWKYSLIEVMIAVSFIIRNCKLSTTTKFEQIRYKYSMMRQVIGGMRVKFELRSV